MHEQTTALRRMKLLITIAERGQGDKVKDVCNKVHEGFHLNFMGHGTAPTRLLEYLGLVKTEKDVIMSVVPEELASKALASLRDELKLDTEGGGIAFTIPIVSAGGPVTWRMISAACGEGEKSNG